MVGADVVDDRGVAIHKSFDPSVFIKEGYNAERAKLIDINKPMTRVDAGMDFAAMAEAEPGDVVLLAPAAASFDQYDSFERRGEDFVREVEKRL